MSLDEAFAKVVGRRASEEERAHLYRLRDALGLADNDAFWSIVMALEYYDSFFRQYPTELAEQTGRCIESARAAFAAAANQEAARMQRVLSEKVAETSAAIARKLAERPVGLSQTTTALSLVVAFGALCVCAGYQLASPERPFWMLPPQDLSPAERGFSMVLAVPAGWMVFALLLPAAACGAKRGWTLATESEAEPRDRLIGWSLVAACLLGCLACAALIAKVT